MTRPQDKRLRLADVCASLHEDDGINPNEEKLAARREARRKPSSKDQQLAKQVKIAVEHALRSRTGDALLQSVVIARVEPAPDATRFAVVLAPAPGAAAVSERAVLERLQGLRGALRTVVAEAITRKRVPELTFALALAAGEEAEGE